jgi:hypothetical protein
VAIDDSRNRRYQFLFGKLMQNQNKLLRAPDGERGNNHSASARHDFFLDRARGFCNQ